MKSWCINDETVKLKKFKIIKKEIKELKKNEGGILFITPDILGFEKAETS